MSSTFVADSKEDKDDSLIIIVNSDGTITVDPETLQKLIANQHGGNVSVVRVDGEGGTATEDQTDSSDDASHINLTVEGFYSQQPQEQVNVLQDINQETDGVGGDVVVDPFSQMEPEHLARLESALQSEQAKEILGTNLGDNLTEMLDILEGNDETPSPSTGESNAPSQQLSLQRLSIQHEEHEITPSEQQTIHNDHSYTSIAPPQQTSLSYHSGSNITSGQASLSVSRPLTRGGRGRTRGTGRVLTRGGSSSTQRTVVVTQQQQSQPTQHQMVSTAKPVTTKSYILSQGGRLYAQSAVTAGEAKIIQKKIENQIKAPSVTTPARVANIAGPTTVSGSDAVIVRTTSMVNQKKIIQRGRGARARGGRRGLGISRGKGIPSGIAEQDSERDKKLDEELAITLKAVEATPPSELIALGPKKKVSTVVVKKVITKSQLDQHSETPKHQQLQIAAHAIQNPVQLSLKSQRSKDTKVIQDISKSLLKSPTETTHQTIVVKNVSASSNGIHPPIKSPPGTPVGTKTPPGDTSSGEESRKKKSERSNSSSGGTGGSGSNKSAPPIVLGPELFSTPDIIRRVSTDKEAVSPVKEGPKVQVQPLHPPIIPAKCAESSNENLIDNVNTGSAKEDAPFLGETVLDDLSCADNNITNVKSSDNHIEQTLEQMELGGTTVANTSQQNQQQQQQLEQKISKPSVSPQPANITPQPYVRKLPPIELPTTRSATKKAAAASLLAGSTTNTITTPKQEIANIVTIPKEKKQTIIIKEKKITIDNRKNIIERKQVGNMQSDFDDEDLESDDESWNSEDDPDRLWCICKKPHNNRFMICCDGCEEWFHGKCVGITKSLGQQMEQQGIEWSCPNCVEAKAQSKGISKPQVVQESQRIIPRTPAGQHTIASLECIVCKLPAKVQSNYCSDVCIKKHTLTMLATLKKETEGLNTATRVVVYEKKTGRLLTGEKAPSVQGLADWLMVHPSFEVVRPNILPPNKYYIKAKDPPNKMNIVEKAATMKQTVLTSKLSGTGVKTVSYTIKPAVTQKQSIQQGQIQPRPVVQQTIVKEEDKSVRRLSKGNSQQQLLLPLNQAVSPTQERIKLPGKEEKIKSSPKEEKPSKPIFRDEKLSRSTSKEEKIEAIKPRKERKSKDGSGSNSNDSKASGSITSVQSKQQQQEDSTPPSKPQPEPVRANVKRTLQELLNQRIKSDPELNSTNDEVKDLVQSIEDELFNLFKDTGAKYKSKYRSLIFNIKDPKNLTLYRKIIDKAISPSQLVRLSPEELANQELAQWREKEAKHQIEIIKKNELDLIHQAKTVVLKSKKGEEVIESKNHEANISELESALNRTADDEDVYDKTAALQDAKKEEEEAILEKLKKELKEKKDERKKEKRRDKKRDEKKRHHSRSHRRSRSRSRHHRDKSRSERRGSDRKHSSERKHSTESKHSSDRKHSSERKKSLERKHSVERKNSEENSVPIDTSFIKEEIKEKQVKEEVIDEPMTPPPPPMVKIKEEDLSDREPSSTVTIQTPPPPEEKPAIWTGVLNMSEVTKLYTSAYEVSGSCEDLGSELSSQLDCVGRIQPDSVWDYVSRMKKAGTKDIVVIRFQADSEEEKMSYLSLYSYLNSRNRMAVIGQISRTVKDFYVLPLASHSPIPQILLPLDGPGFDDYRPHLLLGIIIRNRRGPSSSSISSSSTLSASRQRKSVEVVIKSKTSERSYTPPLPSDGSTTPPLTTKQTIPRGLTPPLPDPDEEPYSPGEDDPYSPEDSMTEEIIVKPKENDIQKNLEEVNRMIEEKRQQIESMTVVGEEPADEEEAYSPSSSFTPPPTTESIPFFDSKSLPDIKLPSNLQEILASIKQNNTADNGGVVKSDPIVQAYANSQYVEEEDEYSRSSSTSVTDNKNDISQEKQPRRDPRQPRIREIDKPHNQSQPQQQPQQQPQPQQQQASPAPTKTSLSQLSDADLIRKAAEMEGPSRPSIQATNIPTSLPPTSIPPPSLPTNIPPPTLPQTPKAMPSAPLPPLPAPDPNYFTYPPPLPPPPFPPQQVYPNPPPPIMPHNLPPPPKKRKEEYEERREGPQPHRRKWEHRDNMGHNSNMNRGRPPPPHHRGGHRPSFRGGNFDPSQQSRMFRGGRGGGGGGGGSGYNRMRSGGGNNSYRGSESEYVPPHRVASEWDEEIRNFEQRKAREFRDDRNYGDRERRDRKRRASRSPSRHKSDRHRMKRASSGSS